MPRFDDFMETALYHPERGYYTSRIKTVGERGDFSTAATLSQCLARAVAALASETSHLNLIEIGPGDGSLSRDLRKHLGFLQKLRLTHHLVERSPVLRLQQKEKLPQARHHATVRAALEACDGQAFIFSNELVDAFPIRIFRKEETGYCELHLSPDLTERFEPVDDLPDSTLFDCEWPIGQRLEVHESYHEWFREWVPFWKSGRLLTIDYGATNDRLYHRSPRGTLRGYLLQNRLEGPEVYQNPGHQDLTADVSFTDLIHWGEALGLKTLSLQSFGEFLAPHTRGTLVDAYLTSTEGPGEAFRVLLQERAL